MSYDGTTRELTTGPRCGLWLAGGRGSVATTSIVGLYALGAGLIDETGCVTANRDFADVTLPSYSDFVVAGRDVSTIPLIKRAEALVEAGLLPPRVVDAVADRLAATDDEIVGPSCMATSDPSTAGAATQAELVDRLAAAMAHEHGFATGTLDFVFIDHDKKAYLDDLQSILDRGWLHRGSIVVADNVKVPGAPKYRAYMREQQGRSFETVEHKTHLEYQTLVPDLVLESEYLC
jgi:hypothetical protein